MLQIPSAALEIVVHTCMLHLEHLDLHVHPTLQCACQACFTLQCAYQARFTLQCACRHASAYSVHVMYTLADPIYGHSPARVYIKSRTFFVLTSGNPKRGAQRGVRPRSTHPACRPAGRRTASRTDGPGYPPDNPLTTTLPWCRTATRWARTGIRGPTRPCKLLKMSSNRD